MSITIKEFLSDINNIDVETKKPKSASTFQLQTVNTVTGKPTVLQSLSIHKPVIDAKRRGDYMEINFIFNDEKDMNLRRIWNMYQEYGRLMNNVTENQKNIPQLLTMLVPVKHNGKKFLYAYNPIFWAPKPKAPGLPNVILSVLYEINSITFVDDMELDISKAIAEADREAYLEQELQNSKDNQNH